MGVSIYYTAKRGTPLSDAEREQVQLLCSRYSVDDRIEEFLRTGTGLNWESFFVYDPADPTEPDVVFEGATGLPIKSEADSWEAVQHWCRLLTDIRKAIEGAEWDVRIEDQDIHWNEEDQEYDPTK